MPRLFTRDRRRGLLPGGAVPVGGAAPELIEGLKMEEGDCTEVAGPDPVGNENEVEVLKIGEVIVTNCVVCDIGFVVGNDEEAELLLLDD